ncbi:MAG TPA: DUF4176 domain-containing protein [Candidatus Limiplasma sp.]|nr:DUF4176 domain-containing protein [Candidatus Limiplasma sp.]
MKNVEQIFSLLPIGSVVLLNDAVKPLMIYGVCQTNKETQREYDYIGVLFPEGNVSSEVQFLFDQADIDRILFTGYNPPERTTFLASLKAFYEKKKEAD